MPRTLITSSKFLNSEQQPDVCLFTGREGGTTRKRFEINALSPWWVLLVATCWLVNIIFLVLLMRKSQSVLVPQSAGASSAWQWKRYAWFLPLYGCVAIFWLFGGLFGEVFSVAPSGLIGWGFLLTLVVSVALAAYGSVWSRANLVQFKLLPKPLDVAITFPDGMQGTHAQYQAAAEAYHRRQANDEDAASRPRSAPVGVQEEWPESANRDWDTGHR